MWFIKSDISTLFPGVDYAISIYNIAYDILKDYNYEFGHETFEGFPKVCFTKPEHHRSWLWDNKKIYDFLEV